MIKYNFKKNAKIRRKTTVRDNLNAEENKNEVLVKDYEDNKNEVDFEDGGSLENINEKVIQHEIIDDKKYYLWGITFNIFHKSKSFYNFNLINL